MSTEALMTILHSAASEHMTVQLSMCSSEGAIRRAEVEPYSIRPKQGHPTLFCWDVAKGRVSGIPLGGIIRASKVPHRFWPRYEIEL